MKSIVEEASSVAKAIEKGWTQAGKPQEFSIKVFEVEQKNFLGITTKSAKIAIYYHDKNIVPKQDYIEKRPYQAQPQAKKPSRTTPHNQPRPSSQQPAHIPTQRILPVAEQPERAPRDVWSEEMIKTAQEWVKETLSLMNLSHRSFTVEAKNYYLKFNFDGPLIEDIERERLLFRSLAHLVMQILRNRFKKGFRGFKIILNSRPMN